MNIENITEDTTNRQLRRILFNYDGWRCDNLRRRLWYTEQDVAANPQDIQNTKEAIFLTLSSKD